MSSDRTFRELGVFCLIWAAIAYFLGPVGYDVFLWLALYFLILCPLIDVVFDRIKARLRGDDGDE